MSEKLFVQYGCGLSAPNGWENFDSSPTLKVKRIPVIGSLIKNKLNCIFPENVRVGDIVRGLPIKDNSVDAVFCSHVLEHLSFCDLSRALKNTYKILIPGGSFRCVLPDLEFIAREYLKEVDSGKNRAADKFIGEASLLGVEKRIKGIKGLFNYYFSNSHHLWMWDFNSLYRELAIAGFKKIRRCQFDDSQEKMFKLVEDKERFFNCLAIECRK